MRSVQAALAEILGAFQVLSAEQVPLRAALGRTLAQAVQAENDLPHFDNSAMDGFAVRSADLQPVPRRLTVIGDVPAGVYPTFTVGEGQAARIMTGGALPLGADTVIPIEATDQERSTAELPATVEVHVSRPAGSYVRRQGEDVQTGSTLLQAGHVLRPQDLGLLAGLGVAHVEVVRRPRVAVLSTGDELLPPDAPLVPGKIRDMNSYTLPAMIEMLGAEALFLGVAHDTPEAVHALLDQSVEQCADLIVSSAGVSVGARDVVKQVLAELGALDFWKVNMRPGKPLAFGHVRGVPYWRAGQPCLGAGYL
ncbi:MAG: molybdopterin molybdotransferase MoeA [Anaerolineae bacterium]|nr:molybdopterin molybdotransferase MoeA [Anaerolineae bacterium]